MKIYLDKEYNFSSITSNNDKR